MIRMLLLSSLMVSNCSLPVILQDLILAETVIEEVEKQSVSH